MDLYGDVKIKIKNYKCIGEEEQGFDEIYPFNIIIGKNNSGKSSLLDLIRHSVYGTPNENLSQYSHKNNHPELIIYQNVSKDKMIGILSKDDIKSSLKGSNQYFEKEYGTSAWGFVNSCNEWYISYNFKKVKDRHLLKINNLESDKVNYNLVSQEYFNKTTDPILNKTYIQLRAERNINPEPSGKNYKIGEGGEGTTNLIQSIIHKSKFNRELVEGNFLIELNKVLNPETNITNIYAEQLENGYWEIFLKERDKGTIALSNTGSGFKMIIIILSLIHLLPNVNPNKKELKNYIFAIEEPENNIHPSLFRRLLKYLHNISISQKCTFFITTHSNIPIDIFSKQEDVQIIHVVHDGEKAITKKVQTYFDNKGILEDLDVRASDILQSNGVVWVEGPSDRIYFNKWIELWTNGGLSEGTHYQCVFYGGKLLAHLDANVPQGDSNNKIQIFNLNRNAIILIDSDKKSSKTQLNQTKKRITQEIEGIGGISWITDGRTIENYIPIQIFLKYYKKKNGPSLNKYNDIAEFLNNVKSDEGNKFLRNKVIFASKISKLFSKEELSTHLDLKEKMDKICEEIRKWNNLLIEE